MGAVSPIAILGYGASGRAAERLARSSGFEPVAYSEDGGGGALCDFSPQSRGDFAFAVVSPAFALDHPWLRRASSLGIALKSELEFGVRACRDRKIRMLAVTGSKGKSSVVKLVSEALTKSGMKAVACGNYGLPVSSVALDDGVRWAVVEVSSFQLETTNLDKGTFEAACVLNLQEDHLDRHGSVKAYHALKRRLLDMAATGFVASETAVADDERQLFAGSYFDNEILAPNAAAAVRLLRTSGVGDAVIAASFAEFEPLAHRMSLVAEFGSVRYVDDSKATSIAALAAGVSMAGSSVRLIAGGLPKGDDPKIALNPLTERAQKVYLIGQCADMLKSVWSAAVDCEICGTLERAVAAAAREAKPGDTVILSPGAASFDQFKSFGERGEVFARLVQKERKTRHE